MRSNDHSLANAAGPNGCGKSTLLRLIMDREKPISGSVSLGQHHILPNYFEQNQVRPRSLSCFWKLALLPWEMNFHTALLVPAAIRNKYLPAVLHNLRPSPCCRASCEAQ